MVSKEKNNDLPDRDILLRYLQGKLPPDEAHRIEKLILNNPIYQEALDGLETLSKEELEQDLKDLSQQISTKTHSSEKRTTLAFEPDTEKRAINAIRTTPQTTPIIIFFVLSSFPKTSFNWPISFVINSFMY